VKKTYIVQLFTEQGSIAKEVEAEDVAAAVRTFVILVGYRKGETISIAEMWRLASRRSPAKMGTFVFTGVIPA
jgi:hypothetical protein